MSFILEALRKSENARRMESAPQMMRVPLAVGRERLPIWAVIVIAVLIVTVAALAATSWRQIYRPAAETAGAVPAALIERRESPMQTLEQPVVNDEPVAESAAEEEASDTATPPAAPSEANASPAPAPATSLPSLAALRAEGLSVPALDMQLHVYSPNRENRFVLVNGSRFGEGDSVAPGLEILRIAAEGAVVRYNGREFLLTAD